MPITRRDFLASSALAAVAGALARPSLAHAWQQQAPTPVFTDIRRRVGYFTLSGGTIGYLNEARGSVVVDSGLNAVVGKAFVDGFAKKSADAAIHRLIHTHHHGDHIGGNPAFKGVARRIVAHATAAEHMKNPPGGKPPGPDMIFPDTTFTDQWREQFGDEWVRAKYYGRAHTSGDAVITFERANVAHMGDLMFNGRHPIVDRAAGASMRNWIVVLEKATADHTADTTYIFGHAGQGSSVAGPRADVMRFRDYLTAVITHVETQVKAGKSREEIFAMLDPLKGFESYGRLPNPQPRSVLHSAYEEVIAK
jgi:glyoxylase-like metal-dependent hydrolase (beta-lactamase superfamily II)